MSADQEASSDPTHAPKGGAKSLVLLIVVAVTAGGAGAAAAIMLQTPQKTEAEPAEPVSYEMLPPDRVMFVPFDEVTVNLNEGRMNRYLRLKISLQIDQSQEKVVTAAIEKQRLILRNWLISHLSDKELDEIRGAAGQNMLRREIRDQFNTDLFSDGYDRVYDVLFEEFNVQ